MRSQAVHNQEGPSTVPFLGGELELHPSKQGLSEELLLFGSHEPVATRYYLQELVAGDHVLDVGSNIGYFLLLAARAVGPAGRVLGFEPAASVFNILKRNLERFPHENIQVFPWAVGAAPGRARFFSSEVPNWGGLVANENLQQTGSTEVEVRSIDALLSQFPDFHPSMLRMDLEGGELMVLEGAKETLEKFRPALFIEFHPFALGWPRIREALAGLHRLGYTSGVLVERKWDHPWIRKWLRERRRWSGPLPRLMERIERPSEELAETVFGLILRGTRSHR